MPNTDRIAREIDRDLAFVEALDAEHYAPETTGTTDVRKWIAMVAAGDLAVHSLARRLAQAVPDDPRLTSTLRDHPDLWDSAVQVAFETIVGRQRSRP